MQLSTALCLFIPFCAANSMFIPLCARASRPHKVTPYWPNKRNPAIDSTNGTFLDRLVPPTIPPPLHGFSSNGSLPSSLSDLPRSGYRTQPRVLTLGNTPNGDALQGRKIASIPQIKTSKIARSFPVSQLNLTPLQGDRYRREPRVENWLKRWAKSCHRFAVNPTQIRAPAVRDGPPYLTASR
jgi:hypothetical protein